MSDKERIESLRAYCNCTWRDLAQRLGVKSVQTFLDIRNGKINISNTLRQKILYEYPEINPLWLNGDDKEMLIGRDNIDNFRQYFPSATDSEIYEGKGMVEYPIGCVLMIHRVGSVANIVSGNDYIVETADYAIARKVIVESADTLRLIATDKAMDNGTPIYKDMIVKTSDIVKMHSIVGYLVPERISKN